MAHRKLKLTVVRHVSSLSMFRGTCRRCPYYDFRGKNGTAAFYRSAVYEVCEAEGSQAAYLVEVLYYCCVAELLRIERQIVVETGDCHVLRDANASLR